VYKKSLVLGNSSYGGLAGKPRKGLICRGLCLEEGSRTGVCLNGGPVGNLGRGSPSRGKFEN